MHFKEVSEWFVEGFHRLQKGLLKDFKGRPKGLVWVFNGILKGCLMASRCKGFVRGFHKAFKRFAKYMYCTCRSGL